MFISSTLTTMHFTKSIFIKVTMGIIFFPRQGTFNELSRNFLQKHTVQHHGLLPWNKDTLSHLCRSNSGKICGIKFLSTQPGVSVDNLRVALGHLKHIGSQGQGQDMFVLSEILIYSSLQQYNKCKHNVDYVTKQNLLHCNIFKLSVKYPKGKKQY